MIRHIRFFFLTACVVAVLGSNAVAAETSVKADTLLQFRTRAVTNGRIDLDDGVYRAKYRLDDVQLPATAESVLRSEATSFGWSSTLDDLRLVSDKQNRFSRHLTFQQTYQNIPVYGRVVRVNVNREGRVSMILSGYKPLVDDARFDPDPVIRSDEAVRLARMSFASTGGETSEPELVVVSSAAPVLAWKVIVRPVDRPAEYVVFLDARSGVVISSMDQAVRRRTDRMPLSSGSLFTKRRLVEETVRDRDNTRVSAVRLTGSGYVYDPDPLTRMGVSYGAPYVDAEDATSAELDAARTLVMLNDISVDGSGLYVLEGPFVSIVGENNAGTITYTPPRVTGPDEFRFSRDQDGFEAVNAYYHIDKSQRYVQSLGITDLQNAPLSVNPSALSRDDSFYFPDRNMLLFGRGGVDDAEDASVLWHEYAHALLEAGSPGLIAASLESASFHEGWSDYWAASYVRSLVESGEVNGTDWEHLFHWDSGDGTIWGGRSMIHTGHYPEDLCVDDSNPGVCSKHNDGRFWAASMMELYTDLGRAVTDELNLRSHAYLSPPMTFRDAAEAIVQADLDYFGGAHTEILLARLGDRGLLDPGSFGPAITHDELPWTESLGGTRKITVEAISLSMPVDRVVVHYKTSSAPLSELELIVTAPGMYEGDLPLPGTPDTFSYFIEAVDTNGLASYLPPSAPTEMFQFGVGPDSEAPSITFNPQDTVPLSTWPHTLVARVTDNLGVDRVSVFYRITNNDADILAEGAFELQGSEDMYSGQFPVDATVLEAHNNVLYYLEAVDASVAGNSTRLPESGDFLLSVEAEGVFRNYDFEVISPNVQLSGVWDQGIPQFGLLTAHSGDRVVGTSVGSAYPASPGLSSMELAPVNLTGETEANLIFWHWYDFEHDGSADPYVNGARLWDGGNVKVSTDGGQTWELLFPEGHYSGDVILSQDNPLSGQRAFGGYSYGWRQEIMHLPEASDVRIRFDVGTDENNSQDARWYAGWYVDDLEITTIRPEDSAPPSAITLPPASSVLSIEEPTPTVEVILTDDNGVADAYFRYEYVRTNGGTSDGRFRIEMLPTGLHTFAGTFDFIKSPAPGDRLTYRILANDHSGNEVLFPPSGEDPFEIEYRLVEVTNIVETATGSGSWNRSGDGWTVSQLEPETVLSSINLAAIDLPENAADLHLRLVHSYRMNDSLGGNVKVSSDAGRTWSLLEPVGAYPDVLDLPDNHTMDAEAGFAGSQAEPVEHLFDLGAYAGRQVRLRVDYASTRALDGTEFWVVESMELLQSTIAEDFDVPRMFALHQNYPNPFRASTRVGYTLHEAGSIELVVFDVLGRRVSVLADGFHDAGTYELTLEGSHLSGGVYILRLISGGNSQDRTLVVVR